MDETSDLTFCMLITEAFETKKAFVVNDTIRHGGTDGGFVLKSFPVDGCNVVANFCS